MDKKLIPAHLVFANWFIRIRWIASSLLLLAGIGLRYIEIFNINPDPVIRLSVILLALNCLHHFFLLWLQKKDLKNPIRIIKAFIHFQIITDLLMLTLLLHFTGGVENPLFILYFFHMIVSSAIFSWKGSYFHSALIILMFGSVVLLECHGLIPHHHLQGFIHPDLYRNELYIYGAGSVFITASLLLVSLTHMVVARSIRIEESYVFANLELEKKDQLKNEYVLRLTHDIKAHLAAIISCLDVVRNQFAGSLSDKQSEFLNRAYYRTHLLVNFVKDLLNLTRKRLVQEIEFEAFSLPEVVNKVTFSASLLARDKSIDFHVHIDKNINTIHGNPFTIEELYTNLLFNALKYTPQHGKIEVIVRNRLDHVVTEISDTGIGIPQEEIPKIFDEFYRASNVPKDINTGSGLGLSIVKQILDNHKGKIWVQSEPGVWTKFTFTLPKKPASYSKEE
ncbi:MAG TPA: HAMP domain-containing sensor histidine kinase [Bacteroidales bacterium]|nr:HAMP domain-containing sensor histidine kinase [Bacteroidales bacterium]HSA44311.1 HAMP domain-containing sensor histidine kinase [Bacteroidales bacterium]